MPVELVLRSPLNGAKVPVAVVGGATSLTVVVVCGVIGSIGLISASGVSITGCRKEFSTRVSKTNRISLEVKYECDGERTIRMR